DLIIEDHCTLDDFNSSCHYYFTDGKQEHDLLLGIPFQKDWAPYLKRWQRAHNKDLNS
ncbi:MAG: hypothetical protein ACI9MF_002323, partial [Gammaproteobacteria bacterium]